jgi:hypothetical protein
MEKVVVKDALEVVEDALHNSEMGLVRILHVETHLLDRVDVRFGKDEVLDSPDQALVDSWVSDRGTRIDGDLGLSVHGCDTRLAVCHTNTLKDIYNVLALLQEDAVGSLLH